MISTSACRSSVVIKAILRCPSSRYIFKYFFSFRIPFVASLSHVLSLQSTLSMSERSIRNIIQLAKMFRNRMWLSPSLAVIDNWNYTRLIAKKPTYRSVWFIWTVRLPNNQILMFYNYCIKVLNYYFVLSPELENNNLNNGYKITYDARLKNFTLYWKKSEFYLFI